MIDDRTLDRLDRSGPEPLRTSPSLNAAWLVVGSLAAVFGLFFGTLQVTGLIAHEERTEVATVDDAAVRVVDVVSDSGHVEVIGADVKAVHITADVSDGMVATRYSHHVVGDRLEVRVLCRFVIADQWCSAKLRIVVPRGLEVKVRAANDRITVRGVAGRVDASSSDGAVEAEALSGEVLLHSSNGSVRATRTRSASVQATSDNGSVRLEFDRPPSSAIARSDNGSVEVSVPRGAQAYAVDLHSDNGSTDNLVRSNPESARRIVASSNNGSVTVRYLD